MLTPLAEYGMTYRMVEGNGQGMNYEDPEQNLYIHLEPGYQLLNGEQAIGIVSTEKVMQTRI